MSNNPTVEKAVEYGNALSFWVEYPSGLVDLSRTVHLPKGPLGNGQVIQSENAQEVSLPPFTKEIHFEFPVEHDRIVRVNKARSAMIIIDMQKYVNLSCLAMITRSL